METYKTSYGFAVPDLASPHDGDIRLTNFEVPVVSVLRLGASGPLVRQHWQATRRVSRRCCGTYCAVSGQKKI